MDEKLFDQAILKFVMIRANIDYRTMVVHTHEPYAIFQLSCYEPGTVNVRLKKDITGFKKLNKKEQNILIDKIKHWYPHHCKKDGEEMLTADFSNFRLKQDPEIENSYLVHFELGDFQLRVLPVTHPRIFADIDNPNLIESELPQLRDWIFELTDNKERHHFLVDSAIQFFLYMLLIQKI